MKVLMQIIFFILTLIPMLPAGVAQISIEGDKIFSVDQLDSILQTLLQNEEHDRFDYIIRRKVSGLAEQLGYFAARIDVSSGVSMNSYVLTITKNQKYKIGKIFTRFLGDSVTGIETQIFEDYTNKTASHLNIKALLTAAVNYYSEQGFPFAQVKLLWIDKIDPDKINLSLELTSGPQVVIDSLIFSGNHNLNRDYLLRKTDLEKEQIFNAKVIRRSLDNLNSLLYLDSVKNPIESFSNNFQSCLLEYNLKRRNSSQIEGAMGYNPATANRAGYLFGFLDLIFFNPLGDGKDFHLHWKKPSQSSSRFAARLHYPYPLGSNLESVWKLSQERYADLYLTLTASLEIERAFTQYQKISAGISWSKISPQGAAFNSIYYSRIYESWLRLFLSTTGNIYDLFGQSLTFTITYLHKRFYATYDFEPPANSINPFKAEISARSGIALPGGIFAVLQVNFAGFSEDESLISPSEMIKLGGHNTIRGYSEEEFVTPRAAWTTLELGLYRERAFRAYLFTDLAYARLAEIFGENHQLKFDNQFLYGAGLGLRLSSQQTTLDISTAWSRESDFSRGILYLIIGNKF